MNNSSKKPENSSDFKRNIFVFILLLLVIIVIIFFSMRGCAGNVNNENNNSTNTNNSSNMTPVVEIPDIGTEIYFGEYLQDAITGGDKKQIPWLVIDKTDDSVLLLSVYTLDCIQYCQTATSVSWETSYIREWLNKDFLNAAFSTDEASTILETTVVNKDNPTHGTPGGNDTKDYIFLLSSDEVVKYLPEDGRQAVNTGYAISQGSYNAGYGVWWLRSPGVHDRAAQTVSYDGSISESGTGVEQDINSVRPALWIKVFVPE